MRKQSILLLLGPSLCLLALFIGLIPAWNLHSTAASQDKPTAAEIASAIEEQSREAAKLTRSQLADQKFQELNAKAQSGGMASVIVQLRVAFRPEGELLSEAGVQAQRALIAQTQDSLIKELTGYDPDSLKRFEYTPYLALNVNAAGLEELKRSSNVINVYEDRLLRPTLMESVPLVGAPFAWAKGFTGAGKTVAILDTGVEKAHPFLSGKVVSEACYSTTNATEHATSLCPGGVRESTAVDSGRNCNGVDGCWHGTHVAGIASGNGPTFSGVAKDANLISIQVFSKVDDSSECDQSGPCLRSFTSDLMKALERVYALRDTHSVASVNMSLGEGRFTSNCDSNPLKGIIDQLRAAGIATTIASGNDSYSDALSEPACISSAISVGATGDTFGANQVSFYSNTAPFLTLLAPGDFITSSVPGGGFGGASGTSFAAPHVAGAWAILKQQNPAAGVTELLNYITSRGFPVTDFRNGLTFRRLNLGPPPGCLATNIPTTHWKGEYYGNIDLTGPQWMTRDDGDGFLNFNFGGGGPGGACDVGVDNFSARWTRMVNFTIGKYRFTVTGDDGVRLYIDGQLKIDKWFFQAPTTYTADIFLTTGLHEVRLEYFEAGGGAVAQLSWENLNSGCYADVFSDSWKGEYYNNTNLAGDPAMVRNDGAGFLNFDFGGGGPGGACDVGVDNFSARWTRRVNFTTGIHRFTVTGDDGVRLYIDGQLKIDKWLFQPPTTYTVELFLASGSHEVKLEYFEACCGAVVRLSWETVEEGNCFASVPSDHWRGEYYASANPGGFPAMIRDDGAGFLNFDVGVGSPRAACGIGADNFMVVWTRWVNFQIGLYRFTVTGDDGVRLYIDGQLKIDKWLTQAPTTYTADVFLTTGSHEVRLQYFEATGGAVAKLSWEALAPNCFTDVPSDHWQGVYYNNTNLTGNPAMIRDDGAGFLDFDFGGGGPADSCGIGQDNFSARWTRRLLFNVGVYRFTVTGDDGVRLYIDGQLKIDKWLTQAPTTYTADVFLNTSLHDIKLEYFEATGGAVAKLSWEALAPNCFTDVPSDHWQGVYYNNTNLTGNPAMIRDDGAGFLDFDFGGGGPADSCGIGQDNFSARWTRWVNVTTTSAYRFTVTADDGVRLWVNGRLVIDKWFTQAPATYTADVTLFPGSTMIRLDYFEGSGGAVARLSWEALPSECLVSSVPFDHWKGQYYNNAALMGDPAMVRDDGVSFLNFNFGGGGPSSTCGIGLDNFSARWTRSVNFAAGSYRFTVTGDDGVRLYINGVLVIDKWFDQAPTTYTVDRFMVGFNTIMLEYFESRGGAQVSLNWTQI